MYWNIIKIFFNSLKLAFKQTLTVLLYTKMYVFLFINKYNKVYYTTILVNINMLFISILYLFKYYYIKIKFLLLITQKYKYMSKKIFNKKPFKKIFIKVPTIKLYFWVINNKNFFIAITLAMVFRQLVIVIFFVCFCYSLEFVLITLWQLVQIHEILNDFLKNLIWIKFFFFAIKDIDWGFFYELTLFIAPEYYLNLPGYTALKHLLLFPVSEFYINWAACYFDLLLTLVNWCDRWIFEIARLIYYWNLAPLEASKPEELLIFKSVMYTVYADIQNFCLPQVFGEFTLRLVVMTKFFVTVDWSYPILELTTIFSVQLTSLIFWLTNFLHSLALLADLVSRSFIFSKTFALDLYLYIVMFVYLGLTKVLIILLQIAGYLVAVYYSWAYFLFFAVDQILMTAGLLSWSVILNFFRHFELFPSLCVYCSFFLVYTWKLFLGYCLFIVNYPIFFVFTFLREACDLALGLFTSPMLFFCQAVGDFLLPLLSAMLVFVVNLLLEATVLLPLLCIKLALACFEDFFLLAFFFFNSDFFFFHCNLDALLWFGIWAYCFIWLVTLHLHLYAQLIERGHWHRTMRVGDFNVVSRRNLKFLKMHHIDIVIPIRAFTKTSKDLAVSLIHVVKPGAYAPVCFVRGAHHAWIKNLIRGCTVEAPSATWIYAQFGSLTRAIRLNLYHTGLQFFLFVPRRVKRKLLYSNDLPTSALPYFFLSFPWLLISATFDALFWFNSSDLWLLQMKKIKQLSFTDSEINPTVSDFNYREVALYPLSGVLATLRFNKASVETSQTIHKYLKFSFGEEFNLVRISRRNFWEAADRNFVFRRRYFHGLHFGDFWSWAFLRAQEFDRYFENQDAVADDPSEIYASDSWYTSPIAVSWSKALWRSMLFAVVLPIVGNFSPILDIMFFLGGREFERHFFSDVAVVQEVRKSTNALLEFDLEGLFVNHKPLQIRELIDYYIYWKALGNIYLKYAERRETLIFNFFKSFENLQSFSESYTAFVEKPYIYNEALSIKDNPRLTTINLLKFGRLKRQTTDYWLNRLEFSTAASYRSSLDFPVYLLNGLNTSNNYVFPRRLNVFWRRATFAALDFAAGGSFGNWSATNTLYETFYSQFYYKYIAMRQNYSFAYNEYERVQFFKKLKLTSIDSDFLNYTKDSWAKKKFHTSSSQKWNLGVMLFFNKLKQLTAQVEGFFYKTPISYWIWSVGANFLAGSQILGWLDMLIRVFLYSLTKIYFSLSALYIPPIVLNSVVSFTLKNFMVQFNTFNKINVNPDVWNTNARLFVISGDPFIFVSPWIGRIGLPIN